MWWWLAGCPKEAAPAVEAAAPAPDGGHVAGPHYILEQAPPAPVPADTPGGGALPVYLAVLRTAVSERITECVQSGPMLAVTQHALVTARIGADGRLEEVTLVRSSGAAAYDECVEKAFRAGRLPAPPPDVLGEDGALVTPEIAFR